MQRMYDGFRGLMMPAPANRSAGSRSLRGVGIVVIGLLSLFLIVAGCAESGSGISYVCANGTPNSAQDATADGITNCSRCNTGYGLRTTTNSCVVTATQWSKQSNSDTRDLRSVLYANSRWLAVGGSGTILTSANASAWTKQSAPAAILLTDVEYGNGTLVVSTDGNRIFTSANASNWTQRTTTAPQADTLYRVAYGSNAFVVVGGGNADETVLDSTTDGVSWIRRNLSTNRALYGVGYGNNRFVAVGNGGEILLSSSQGSWSKITNSDTTALWGVHYASGRWVAVGSGGAILDSTTDGASWIKHNNSDSNNLRATHYANGRWVAVGDNGTILTSTNGTSWTKQSNSDTNQLWGIHYANGRWVAVGSSGTILTAP